MKLVFGFLFVLISLLFIPTLFSEASFNGSNPGCGGSGCHSFSDGDVSITILDSANIEVLVTGTSSRVGGELVDEQGNVVDFINSTNTNPFVLTAPSAGNYIVNAGYKNPSRNWDSAFVALVVPVELNSFTASINQNDVTLTWQTSSELNNFGFEIERMQVGDSWYQIGFVNGNGTSTDINSYTFVDKKLAAGNYMYRIKQIDFDGTFEYYNLDDVVDITVPLIFKLLQNYPNPFNPSTKIKFTLFEKTNVRLTVFTSIGEEVVALVNDVKSAGNYQFVFDANDLTSGIYYYKLTSDNFVETKKMMLIK